MSQKTLIWLGASIGGTIGSYMPSLFGAGPFSGWSILLGAVGGVLGVWVAYKISR